MIDITEIIKAALALITAVTVTFLIPWIREKTTLAQREKLSVIVKTLVQAAEQLYGAGLGKEKLDYVVTALNGIGYAINPDDIGSSLRAMIESAVLELTVESKNQ